MIDVGGSDGADRRIRPASPTQRAAIATRPRLRASGSSAATMPSAIAVVESAGLSCSVVTSACRTVPGCLTRRQTEIGHVSTHERERLPVQTGDERCGRQRDRRVDGPAQPAACRLDGERHERQPADRREQGAYREGETAARIPPAEREQCEGDGAVEQGCALRGVAEWEERREQGHCQSEPGQAPGCERCRHGQENEEPGWPEREQRAAGDA